MPHASRNLPEPPAIATRLERAIGAGMADAACSWAARYPESDLIALEIGGGWVVAGEGRSPLARAVGLGFDGPVAERTLDRVEAVFRERGQAPRFDVCAYAHPSLLALLAARRYVPQAFMSAFARPLESEESIGRIRGHEPPDNLRVTRLDRADGALVDVAVDLMARCFHQQGPPADWLVRVTRQGILQEHAVTFLAYLDDEPVAGACLARRDDLAMLFGGGVLPAYRRRGIHGALVQGRLLWARDSGAKLASVQSVPGTATERIARRAGFEHAYTKIVLVGEVS